MDSMEHTLDTRYEFCISESVNMNRDLQKLKAENLKLKDAKVCRICSNEDISRMLLPCGHLVVCSLCCQALLNCPLCKGVLIRGIRRFQNN